MVPPPAGGELEQGSQAIQGPDLLSCECDHVQGPIHEAPAEHLWAALTHHGVAGPVVGSDILAGGDRVRRGWEPKGLAPTP